MGGSTARPEDRYSSGVVAYQYGSWPWRTIRSLRTFARSRPRIRLCDFSCGKGRCAVGCRAGAAGEQRALIAGPDVTFTRKSTMNAGYVLLADDNATDAELTTRALNLGGVSR